MNIDRIEAAAARLEGHAVKTPLLTAPLLNTQAGRRIFVKAECLQKTGSFKYRGARAAISALDPEMRTNGVLAYSSGNHAQGIACVAGEFGVPAVIVMPADAPALKIENTRSYGAEVVLYDRAKESREDIGAELSQKRGLTLIPPYDAEDVIAGQGTVGLEIAEQAASAGITEAEVITCCGGGGLTSGISLALAAKMPGFQTRPAEPEGFDDVTRSLAAGARQTNNQMTGSICDAVLTPSPGKLTFPIMQAHCGPGLVVSDAEAQRAMAAAFLRLKIVVEPGGAVALAAAMFHAEGDHDIIVTASGGNVDPPVFQAALEQFGNAV